MVVHKKIENEKQNVHPAALPVPYQTLVQAFQQNTGKVFLLYGDPAIFSFSLRLAAYAVGSGKAVPVIDGCNRFDVHLITRIARERKIDPDIFLKRIFVSRGFTCFQMEAAITDKLPLFLSRRNTKAGFIFGLLDTFYDEQASFREVCGILRRVSSSLQAMKENGISILITTKLFNVQPKERNQLFVELRKQMDRVYKLNAGEMQKPQLFLEDQKLLSIKQ